jgi:hypothetical protein
MNNFRFYILISQFLENNIVEELRISEEIKHIDCFEVIEVRPKRPCFQLSRFNTVESRLYFLQIILQ